MVGEVDDLALPLALDGRVRLVDETLQPFRQPVVTARLPSVAVHALLDDHPAAVVGDDEAVQIEVETVLHGGAVDLGDQAAGRGKGRAVEADTFADHLQLVRRLARMSAASAADMDAELARQRRQPALQRADDAGGDSGRMPVHAHHRTEGLEPEGMRQPAQQLVAAIMVDDRLAQHRAEPRHAVAQPLRDPSAMQRQVGAAASLRHLFRCSVAGRPEAGSLPLDGIHAAIFQAGTQARIRGLIQDGASPGCSQSVFVCWRARHARLRRRVRRCRRASVRRRPAGRQRGWRPA